MPVSTIRKGAIYPTKKCGDVEVINYIDKYNVEVIFLRTGTVRTVTTNALRGRYSVDNNQPSLYEVGYLGYGNYTSRESDGKRKNRAYMYWSRMLKRCYDVNSVDYPSYGEKGVTVCEEWHNFQNFAEWFYNQPFYDRKGYHLDKDMTVIGNKVYSPDACNLIPEKVNTLCVKNDYKGISWHKEAKKWVTNLGGKSVRSLDATYLLALYENYKIGRVLSVLREEYAKGNIPMKMVINVYNYVKEEYNTVTHPEVEKPFGEDLKTLFILRGGLLGGHHG